MQSLDRLCGWSVGLRSLCTSGETPLLLQEQVANCLVEMVFQREDIVIEQGPPSAKRSDHRSPKRVDKVRTPLCQANPRLSGLEVVECTCASGSLHSQHKLLPYRP
eukprot:2937144-Amphidinium_carterae.1